jgi:hypothetical protein
MELDDEALMATLREITRRRLDPEVQAHIAEFEKSGPRVTLYEVLETGAVLVIVHDAVQPSMSAVRTAYARHMSRQAGRTLQ